MSGNIFCARYLSFIIYREDVIENIMLYVIFPKSFRGKADQMLLLILTVTGARKLVLKL
jgi:hypothetical protein